MKTSKTNSKSKTQKKSAIKSAIPIDEQKPSLKLAEDGHRLAALLRQKLLANLTPELQEMLFVQDRLADIWDEMAPSDFHRVPRIRATHGNLLKNMQKAEYLLTGLGYGNLGLEGDYEKRDQNSLCGSVGD